MRLSIRLLPAVMLVPVLLGGALLPAAAARLQEDDGQTTHYVRYRHGERLSYGELEGDVVYAIEGDLFGARQRTGESHPLAAVQLLAPVVPSKVIAVGLNYRSHLGNSEPPKEPPLFAKLPTSIVGPDEPIVLPPDARVVHYEAELVLVIGKRAKNVAKEDAADYILGVTCGNDVSARAWQGSDLQWFRAKASDTFGPIGPAVVTGLDYDDLLLEGRLNGETGQKQRTSDLLFDAAEILSYTSRYVTLEPGDLVFTGTPGTTTAIDDGDVVEIELEGVGILRNPVVRAK